MTLSNSTIRATIPAIVAVVFLVARRFVPATSQTTITHSDEVRFSSFQWRVGGSMLIVLTIFGFLSYGLLVWTNHTLAEHDNPSLFLLLPTHWIWMFFPIFGAICVAWELTLRLWALLSDDTQARKYEAWSNSKAGFNATSVLRYMTLFIALPIGVLTALALPIHTSLNNATIVIGHYGTLTPRIYSYSEIRGLTVTEGLRTRDGRLTKRPAIVVDFANGDRWSSADNRDTQPSIDSNLLNFLQAKTGLKAKYIDAYPFGAI